MFRKIGRGACAAILTVLATTFITTIPASAQDVRITQDTLQRTIQIGTEQIKIGRIQDTSNTLTGTFAKTSRPCPPFCIHPISVAPGVTTVGELEVMAFLEDKVANRQGVLIDTRMPSMFEEGSIPGAVNVPHSTLLADNPFRNEILKALGARQTGNEWDYTDAITLTLFCNGPWCDQSPTAIRNLMAAGYPVEKMNYYRGGMQLWSLLGLTVKHP